MTATTFYFVSSPKTGNVYLSSNYGKVISGFLFLMVALDPSKIYISFLFTFSFSSSSCYFQFKSITTVGLLVFICVKAQSYYPGPSLIFLCVANILLCSSLVSSNSCNFRFCFSVNSTVFPIISFPFSLFFYFLC